MSKSDTVFLSHILDAINQIEIYTAGLTFREFTENRLIQDGVIRPLEIIGIVLHFRSAAKTPIKGAARRCSTSVI